MELLGDSIKKGVMFFEMETGSSIYQEQTPWDRAVKYCDMNTLDSIVQEYNFTGEFFIKLDVQGAEIDVLKGGRYALEKTNFILLEASLLNYNDGAPLIADVIDFLNKNDFVLFDICELKRKPDFTLFQVDLIFSRRNSIIREKVNFKRRV